MRRFITGLSIVLAGASLGSCSKKQVICPAAGTAFTPLTLSTSLANWDHSNASFDGEQVVVAFSQGALGNDGASSVWSEAVSCAGEVGAPVMISRALATGAQPAETLSGGSTWFVWGVSSTATTGDGPDAGTPVTDGGTDADAGVETDTDGGTADGGVVLTPVQSPVNATKLAAGTEVPTAVGFTLPITRNDALFENLTEVHQLIGGAAGDTALAGGRAVSSDRCLIPFVQRFDQNALTPVGAAGDLEPSDALGCLIGPTAIAGDADDGFHFAWAHRVTGTSATDPSALLFAKWDPENDNLAGATTVTIDTVTAPSASQGSEEKNAPHYLAFAKPSNGTDAGFIKVIDMNRGIASELKLEIAATDTLVGRPLVAGAENGGALAWTVTTAGGERKMFVQRFTYVSGTFGAVATIFDVSTQAATTVGTVESITHLTGNSYFVTWTQTRSANERNLLRGGFVTF